ncbi:alpha-amylase A-like [Anopheles maculipalpis]|uniref:alpha-amylase A-like n=1 Tax=Anopheles maculipalpis TaxID=1496333 RepID=UPI002159884A|nr:alpha-amylase A-like [Anopheles maculipalpis]
MLAVLALFCFSHAFAQFDPHFKPGRHTIVQLFEWRYKDIERECRTFLGPNGFGAVQLSPVNEVRDGTSWEDRYEPVSYKLTSRSGNESALRSAIDACNKADVRVFVEVVFNHMARAESDSSTQLRGTAGSTVNPTARDYPDAPYSAADFNDPCRIMNPEDPHELRNCWKEERPDLNLSLLRVRERILGFLNRLLSFGVAGFFVDSALYMWPHDLQAMFTKLHNLTTMGDIFPPGSRPFICFDLSYHGLNGAEKSLQARWNEYADLGVIAQDRFAYDIGDILLKRKPFHYFVNLGTRLGYVPREKALIYVNDPQLQRLPDADGDLSVISVRNRRAYQIGLAFMLAHRYGMVRMTSSFEFLNSSQGPPTDAQGRIEPVQLDQAGTCRSPWICEHRWPIVRKMVYFRRVTNGTGVRAWVDNGQNQIGFCRDRVGFVAFNAEISLTLKAKLYTCLPEGVYCDLISSAGDRLDANGDCSGGTVKVEADGHAEIFIHSQLEEPFIALLNTLQP